MDLIIIGNGFDLEHGLKTRYSDFKNYLTKLDGKDCVLLEKVYKFGDQWCDFEDGLGKIKDTEEALGALKMYNNQGGYIVEKTLRDRFPCWIKAIHKGEIDAYPPRKVFSLSTSDLYFSFNYTHTLFDSYGIPLSNTKHIHGCVASQMCFGNEAIIFGHAQCYGDVLAQRLLDNTTKDVNGIKANNKSYFDSLSKKNIDTIKVFGHSYSDIDFPYFQEIRNQLPNAKWMFGCYDESDQTKAFNYIYNLQLKESERELVDSKDMFKENQIYHVFEKKNVNAL
ncbi:MAG: AbiH family protein [Paludibacteraceae bacterium]